MARFRSIDLLHIILCTQSSNSSTALCPLCELRWIISFPRVRRSTRSQRVLADPWLVQTLNKQLAFICLQQIIINLGHPTAQRVVWKPSFIFIQQQLFHLCSKVPWLKQEKTLQFQNEPPKKNDRPLESSFIEPPLYRPKRFISSRTFLVRSFLEFNQTRAQLVSGARELLPERLHPTCLWCLCGVATGATFIFLGERKRWEFPLLWVWFSTWSAWNRSSVFGVGLPNNSMTFSTSITCEATAVASPSLKLPNSQGNHPQGLDKFFHHLTGINFYLNVFYPSHWRNFFDHHKQV